MAPTINSFLWERRRFSTAEAYLATPNITKARARRSTAAGFSIDLSRKISRIDLFKRPPEVRGVAAEKSRA
jgi:hypothetical protein